MLQCNISLDYRRFAGMRRHSGRLSDYDERNGHDPDTAMGAMVKWGLQCSGRGVSHLQCVTKSVDNAFVCCVVELGYEMNLGKVLEGHAGELIGTFHRITVLLCSLECSINCSSTRTDSIWGANAAWIIDCGTRHRSELSVGVMWRYSL